MYTRRMERERVYALRLSESALIIQLVKLKEMESRSKLAVFGDSLETMSTGWWCYCSSGVRGRGEERLILSH